MHPLCIWLKVKAAKLRRPGHMETDSACCPVTVSFPGPALLLAEGHKDPIVIWPLVPWAKWPLTRARPKGEEDEISCQHPSPLAHSHWANSDFPSALCYSQRTLIPIVLRSGTVSQVEKSEFTKHIRGLSRQNVLLMVTLVAHVALK